MSRFQSLSDSELTRSTGIPVISFLPEDLPHQKSSIDQLFTFQELSERTLEVQERWLKFFPAVGRIDNFHALSSEVAKTRSAMLTSFRLYGPGRPDCFSILKPSETISGRQLIAEDTGLQTQFIRAVIPDDELRFIIMSLEIAHMQENARGGQYVDLYDEEFEADKAALEHYLSEGGDMEVVREYINERALAVFYDNRIVIGLRLHCQRIFLKILQPPTGKEDFLQRVN